MAQFFGSQFVGLVTEVNPFQAPAWSFSTAMDVQFSKDNFVYPRHGHPPGDNTMAFKSSNAAPLSYESMGTYLNPNDGYRYIVSWIKDNSTGRFGLVINRRSGSTSNFDASVNQYGYTPASFTANFPPIVDILPSPYSTIPFFSAFTYKSQQYALGPWGLGWFVASSADFDTLLRGWDNRPFNQVSSISVTLNSSTDFNWFQTDKQVELVFMFERRTSDGRVYQSNPVARRVVKNITGVLKYLTLSVGDSVVTAIGEEAQKGYLKVYRTLQYGLDEEKPTQHYLCGENDQVGISTPLSLNLTVNDDTLLNFERLYTDPDQEGIINGNELVPPAKDVVNFKDYFIYSNIVQPFIAKIALVQIPTSGNTVTFRIRQLSGSAPTAHLFTFGTDIDIPSNATYEGQQTAAGTLGARTTADIYNVSVERPMSWTGISHSAAGTTTPELRSIRIVPGVNNGQVRPYGAFSNIAYTGASSQIRDLVLTINTGDFDVTRFSDAGILCITETDGDIKILATYTAITYDTAAGTVTFKNATSHGAGYIPIVAAGFTGAVTAWAWSIPGTNVTGLPVYAGDMGSYFSLLPAIDRLQTPVAVTAVTTGNSSWSSSGALNIVAYLQYVGVTFRSQAELLEQQVENICDAVNFTSGSALLNTKLKAIKSSADLNEFFLQSWIHTDQYMDMSTSNDALFLPKLQTSMSNSAEVARAQHIRNGLVITKKGQPEFVPAQQLISPVLIGERANNLLKAISNEDTTYLFKEKEGIYRMDIVDGPNVPQVENTVLIDNTVWCIASESVQAIDKSIYFLSNRGFARLTGSTVEIISKAIETDIRSLSTLITAPEKIRSFGNNPKKLYGCHFPGVSGGDSVTYIFDIETRQWSTSRHVFDFAVVDELGRLFTAVTDYKLDFSSAEPTTTAQINASTYTSTKLWKYIRQDMFTSAQSLAAADQYDESKVLTGYTVTPGSAAVTISKTITDATPTENLRHFAARLKNKQLWYKLNSNSTLYPVTITNITGPASNATSGTTSMVLAFETGTDVSTAGTSDTLLVGVNAELMTQPFNGGDPSLLKQFAEAHLHTSDTPSNMSLAFANDLSTSYGTETVFNTVVAGRTVWRTWVPLENARGRMVTLRFRHNKPMDYFNLIGIFLKYRDTGSSAVSKG